MKPIPRKIQAWLILFQKQASLLSRLLSFLGSPKILSIIAIVISYQSLKITSQSNERDIYFKELSLMPRLTTEDNMFDLTLNINNVGPGAASIKGPLVIKYKDNCLDSSQLNVVDWPIKFDRLMRQVVSDIETTKFQMQIKHRFSITFASLMPEQIIPAGSRVRLMQGIIIGFPNIAAADIRGSEFSLIENSLGEAFGKLSFHIEYCSISGGICMVKDRGDAKCEN